MKASYRSSTSALAICAYWCYHNMFFSDWFASQTMEAVMQFEEYLPATAVYVRPLSSAEQAELARDGLFGFRYVTCETCESVDIQYHTNLSMAGIFARQQGLELMLVH